MKLEAVPVKMTANGSLHYSLCGLVADPELGFKALLKTAS